MHQITVNSKSFDIKHICECGQVFRFKELENGDFVLFETDEMIKVKKTGKNSHIIETRNAQKHTFYFDLQTDYDKIKCRLKTDGGFLVRAIASGEGIRILKQDLAETIVSFIISANNNIPRIKNTIEKLCSAFGTKREGIDGESYFTFPTLDNLARATEKDFKKFGAGYRAPYLVETIRVLFETDFLKEVSALSTNEARKKLITLPGVGPKVADCVLLFGLEKTDVMPCDTWIKKVYKENFDGTSDDIIEIRDYFLDKFKDLAGYAQQYMFYYKRSFESKT